MFLDIIFIFPAAFVTVFHRSFANVIAVRLDMTVRVDVMMLFRSAASAVVWMCIYVSENICSSENNCSQSSVFLNFFFFF